MYASVVVFKRVRFGDTFAIVKVWLDLQVVVARFSTLQHGVRHACRHLLGSMVMNAIAMEQELVREFAANNFTLQDPAVAQQCASLCASLGLKPAELVASWELFYLNSCMEDGTVLGAQLDNFRQFLQNEQKESFRRERKDFHFYSKDDVDMLLNVDSEGEGDVQSTPVKKVHGDSPNFKPTRMEVDDPMVGPKTPGSLTKSSDRNSKIQHDSSPATPFSQRSSKCTVQFVFNKHIPETYVETLKKTAEDDILRRLRPIEASQLQILSTGPRNGIRFMYDRMEDKFNYLEKRIKKFAIALAEQESMTVNNHVAIASQERILVVGMVCCDAEGHLNDRSVLLQGSVEHSGGHRVRLDLNNLERFSLFPGQIVGVEGHNPSGHCLVASRLVESILFPVHCATSETDAPPSKRQLLDMPLPVRNGTQRISMVMAAGPFTTSDNLAFEPLAELLDFARKKRPNVLLLMGPFVDSEHPQIKLGVIDRTFHKIFQEEIRTRIEEYCQEMGNGARVVLVPSTRDAHHDFVFPQPPFNINAFEDPDHQITLLENPGLFSLNELTIGCCTVDVLRHLSSEEASRVPASAPSDRLARLAAHIIGQRCFYPLYPAASGIPLDLSLSLGALHFSCQPDILIVPSDLAPFVKTLSLPIERGSKSSEAKSGSTLCINPGRLAKGINGGNFTDILTIPFSDGGIVGSPRLQDRARVSIMRI